MLDLMMTTTGDHYRSNGVSLTYVTYNFACTPADAIFNINQAYPNEKLFATRQVFTKYDGVRNGDYIDVDGIRYAVRTVNKYEELHNLDKYFQLLVEEGYGS